MQKLLGNITRFETGPENSYFEQVSQVTSILLIQSLNFIFDF